MGKEIHVLTTRTVATEMSDGFWEVISQIIMGRRQNPEDEFETRTIAAKAIDRDINNGVQVAYRSVNSIFAELDHDLFNLPKEQDGKYFADPLKDIENT